MTLAFYRQQMIVAESRMVASGKVASTWSGCVCKVESTESPGGLDGGCGRDRSHGPL